MRTPYIRVYVHWLKYTCVTHTYVPRPDLPTKRRSGNLATCSAIRASQFFISATGLNLFPAESLSRVPSGIALVDTTRKGTCIGLFTRQWCGRGVQYTLGWSVGMRPPASLTIGRTWAGATSNETIRGLIVCSSFVERGELDSSIPEPDPLSSIMTNR